MSVKQIVLLGTGTAVVGGGMITGGYFLLSDNSINRQLIAENKKILDTSADDAYWEIKLSSYTRDEKSKNDLRLQEDKVNYLKEWCTNTLKNKFSNKENKNYQSAKSLCTVPTHKEKLLKDSKTILSTGGWASKQAEYRLEGNRSLISTIERTTATAQDLENWCNININNEYKKDDQNIHPLTLKWCTQQGS